MPDFLDALDHCASIEWTRANSHIISVVVCTPSSYCNVFPASSGFVFLNKSYFIALWTFHGMGHAHYFDCSNYMHRDSALNPQLFSSVLQWLS
jgi:hypothetical protein